MNIHTCRRCGYSTTRLSNIISHIHRKNICKVLLENISIEDIRLSYNNDKINNKYVKEYRCELCQKILKNSHNKSRHLKNCKEKNNIDIEIPRVIDLQKQLKDQMNINNKILKELRKEKNNTIQNITQNITQNNNINIINLNNFGKENLDHLTPEFLSNCLLKLDKGFTTLIENIHFNKDVPENINILLKSEKKNLLKKVEDGKWIDCDKNNTLDELINKGFKILGQHYFNCKDEEDKFVECKDVIMDFFYDLNQQTNDYFNLRRELFITIKNNTAYLMGK